MPWQKVILVSGAPGSGKSTLAAALAERLQFAIVSKDLIKETLHDSLGVSEADAACSTMLGQAAMDVLWELARMIPQVVLDANFRRASEKVKENIATFGSHLVEVYCYCPPEEAMRRYNSRAATRHQIHFPAHLELSYFCEYDEPVTGSAAISVDTTRVVDIENLADQLDGFFSGAPHGAPNRDLA